MRIKHARIAAALVCLCAVVGGAGCGDDDDAPAAATTGQKAAAQVDDSKPPVRFALVAIGPPVATVYNLYGTGADAAAKVINDQGSFGGRKVVIDKCNSMLQASAASVCAHKTIAKDPVAMFGCEIVWSATGLPIYAKAGVPSFNCANSQEDVTNPWSFDLKAGGNHGYFSSAAKLACSRADVKKVVAVALDVPQTHTGMPAAVDPVLSGCQKDVEYFYVPPTAVDITPHANRILKAEPDFVITQVTEPATVQLYKAFEQAGFPASQVVMPEGGCSAKLLDQGGTAMDGAFCVSSHKPWDAAGDPEVAAYTKAVQALGEDHRDLSVEYGYSDVMWFYTVAKAIGFDKFTSRTLADYMKTKTGVRVPLSGVIENPGPAGSPQVKQPYQLIYQWKDGRFQMAPVGPEQDGLVNAY